MEYPRCKSLSGEGELEYPSAVSKEMDVVLCHEASLLQPDLKRMGSSV